MKVLCFLVLLLACYHSWAADPTNGCCAPPQWEVKAMEGNNLGQTAHHIYYDANSQQIRWDRLGNLETPNEILELHTYTNYAKGIEFLYYPAQNYCLAYGPDQFTQWCYGPLSVGQSYLANITINGNPSMLWNNPENNMYWVSSVDTCLPINKQHINDIFWFYDDEIGISDPSVFTPPSICQVPPSANLVKSRYSIRSIH